MSESEEKKPRRRKERKPPVTSELLDRQPPCNIEAEMAVLGSILLLPDNCDEVALILRPDDFYDDANRRLYEHILKMYDEGRKIDLMLLIEALKSAGHYDLIGGAAYLNRIRNAVATPAHAVYYAQIVRSKATFRSLILASTEILREAYDESQDPREMLSRAEQKIFSILDNRGSNQVSSITDVLNQALDRMDARMRGEHIGGGVETGYHKMDEMTGGLHNSELIVLAARPSMGKCLTADAEILLTDGQVVTIEQIVRQRGGELLSLNENFRLEAAEPSAFVDDGVKPAFRVTTRLGRAVTVTASHPFLTVDGWRPLAELSVGEFIAAPRRMEVFGREEPPEQEIESWARQLADDDRVRLAPRIDMADAWPPVDIADAAERRAVCLSGLSVTRSQGLSREGGPVSPSAEPNPSLAAVADRPTSASPFRKDVENGLTPRFSSLAIGDERAEVKHVPSLVFRATRQRVALFLNRLFALGGWAEVRTAGQAQISYAAVNERLARQVQHLLLRFGIIAALRDQPEQRQDDCRRIWRVEITDAGSLRTFCSEIGVLAEEATNRCIEETLDGSRCSPGRDLIPANIWRRIEQLEGAVSWTELKQRLGLDPCADSQAISRECLRQIAQVLGDRQLYDLAESDVYWDEIVSIEYVGERQVYDLTIPRTHNFVANDICVHNTAFAMNLAEYAALELKVPTLFVSLEMSAIELADRLLCSVARVNGHRLRNGTISNEDRARLVEKAALIAQSPLYVDDSPSRTVTEIAAGARRIHRREGRLGLIVIDYLQLIEPDNAQDPRQEQVARMTRRLKGLARDMKVPILCLAQLNRQAEVSKDNRPKLSHLRESGAIEQDADVVMFVHREEYYRRGEDAQQFAGQAEIIIAKQRNGPVGDVELTWRKEFTRFENPPDKQYDEFEQFNAPGGEAEFV